MQDLQFHREYMPSFGLGGHQMPVCNVTVLKPGMSGRDCAAYHGVVPSSWMDSEEDRSNALDVVCRHGNKVSEATARELFDLGDLKYRL